jgi:hypothetical protein
MPLDTLAIFSSGGAIIESVLTSYNDLNQTWFQNNFSFFNSLYLK